MWWWSLGWIGVLDFSIQYERKGTGALRRLGYVVLENTRKGQFRSAKVAGRLTDFLEEDVRRALHDGAPRLGHLAEFVEEVLEPGLEEFLERYGLRGAVGGGCDVLSRPGRAGVV